MIDMIRKGCTIINKRSLQVFPRRAGLFKETRHIITYPVDRFRIAGIAILVGEHLSLYTVFINIVLQLL